MNITEEEFLEHYGVAGMKWGQRKAARQQNRQLNKASRQKDRQKFEKDVDRARARFDSGKARADYKKAKADYKVNKEKLGSYEAKKILQKTKDKNIEDYNKAIQPKNGKEFATQLLAGAAASFVIGKVLSG